jgi:diadenosine tetraphosphatase ApaH/serine/threonine PP2A family protein phosphatase
VTGPLQAVVSDIHGNYEALQATLEYIDNLGNVDEIVCLGDIVGYGPWPEECVDVIMERCSWCLCGNHDVALLGQPLGFNPLARDAIEWQRSVMKPGLLSLRKKRRWRYLENLWDRHKSNGTLYVHASPRDPVMEYIEESDTVDMGFGPSDKIIEIMSLVKHLCFVGHSHRPGIVTADYQWLHPSALPDGKYEIPEGSKALCNIGSVGQPRDEDPRCCFVTFDRANTVQFHRVEYNIDAVIEKVKTIAKLHIKIGERLKLGK